MIKVGILSMQRIFNYGSFLQAYGLKKILEDLGCKVEFVDYHRGECLVLSGSRKGLLRKISKVLEVFYCNTPLKEKICYIKYKKNYAANYYPYLEIGREMNYTPEIDLLIIGSDEVFNCVQNNTNVGFSPELFGDGNHAGRLISYAASFGNTTLQKLEQYKVKNKVSGWLERFDAVSVRDANSGSIIKNLTGKEPEYNLDPVLVYDFIGKCKDIPLSVSESGYMILYGYSGRFSKEECKAIRAYTEQKKLRIFCIGGVQHCCDKFIDCSPFQVIAYFQHAEAVVTDTFHGTIISVIAHRKFVSLVRSNGYGNSEKLIDLLERLHLEDRVIHDMKDLNIMLNIPIRYENVDDIIKTEQKHTYDYLRREIKKCTQN